MTRPSKSLIRSACPFLVLPILASSAPGQTLQYNLLGDAYSNFGECVSRVGDLDGDGYQDFIVGVPRDNNNERGGAIVYSGATGNVIVNIKGPADYSHFGDDVEGRLDLDGDGFNDVLIGATGDTGGGSVTAYSPHLQTKLYKIFGPSNSDFGISIRTLEADLDGDGIEDFIVGAPLTSQAFVYSGKTGSVIFSKTGQANAGFGTAVCRAGDLDGDHVCDFLVGSPTYTDPTLGVIGRVAAFSGATGKKLWDFDGPNNLSKFGSSVTEPGDLDGDGVADCVVGAFEDDGPTGAFTGSVSAISGATGTLIYRIMGDASGDWFGFDVRAVAGDIDRDGVKDYIVGAPLSLSSPSGGYARTISGASGRTLHTYFEQTVDPTGNYYYGWSVTGGDFNGDGVPDVLIGNSSYNNGEGIVEVVDTDRANWQNYGSGWPGTHGIPAFIASNPPVIGQPISLTIYNSAGAATSGLLFVGISQANIPTSKGGTLLVAPLLILTLSLPTGSLTLSDNVPNDPAIAGLDAYLQTIEFDAGASKGLSFSQGLDLHFEFN